MLIPNGHHSPENVEQPGGVRHWHLVRPPAMPPHSDSAHRNLDSAYSNTHNGKTAASFVSTLTGRGSSSGGGATSNSNAANSAGAATRNQHSDGGGTLTKSIPEIYLTRLLTSKGTVQKFVDDFFAAALRVTPQNFPPVIKYLFDLLEHEAKLHEVEDAGVVYAWKNNSLPLRFWVNIIKNPDFVFDVDKTPTVDSCLSTVAQTFMDACSPSETHLSKDSPSNKLLFAKDLPRYRQMVTEFYRGVARLPTVTEQDLGGYMAQLSKSYAQEFNVMSAVRELLSYAIKFHEPLLATLDDDAAARRHRLADRLEQVLVAVAAPPHHRHPAANEGIYAAIS